MPRGPGKLEVVVQDSEDKTFSERIEVPAAAPSSTTSEASPAARAASVPEPADFWMGEVNAPTPETLRGATVIRAPDLAALVKRGGLVLVDVSNSPPRPQKLAPQQRLMSGSKSGAVFKEEDLPLQNSGPILLIPNAAAGDSTTQPTTRPAFRLDP